MATAVAKVAKKTVDRTVDEKVVKLELSEKEAEFLVDVMVHIGRPEAAARSDGWRMTQNIDSALRNAGVLFRGCYFKAADELKLSGR